MATTDTQHMEKLKTYWKQHHAFPSMSKLYGVVVHGLFVTFSHQLQPLLVTFSHEGQAATLLALCLGFPTGSGCLVDSLTPLAGALVRIAAGL